MCIEEEGYKILFTEWCEKNADSVNCSVHFNKCENGVGKCMSAYEERFVWKLHIIGMRDHVGEELRSRSCSRSCRPRVAGLARYIRSGSWPKERLQRRSMRAGYTAESSGL